MRPRYSLLDPLTRDSSFLFLTSITFLSTWLILFPSAFVVFAHFPWILPAAGHALRGPGGSLRCHRRIPGVPPGPGATSSRVPGRVWVFGAQHLPQVWDKPGHAAAHCKGAGHLDGTDACEETSRRRFGAWSLETTAGERRRGGSQGRGGRNERCFEYGIEPRFVWGGHADYGQGTASRGGLA